LEQVQEENKFGASSVRINKEEKKKLFEQVLECKKGIKRYR